ncbi:MAG: CYTH domain-containing protein [Candidatus Latescibacterota bacterium]
MAIESEIKFTVPDRSIFDQIAALREVASFEARNWGIHHHRDTYFDTGDFLLLRSKVVFRLRESRKGAVLTFKAQAPGGGGFYRRVEVEAPTGASVEDIGSGSLPRVPPVDELRKRFGNLPLLPALTVENNRRVITLSRIGIPRFELDLDDVTFSGPHGKAGVLELEVESLGWEDASLRDIGAWLRKRFELEPAGPSKYILGMEMVGRRE